MLFWLTLAVVASLVATSFLLICLTLDNLVHEHRVRRRLDRIYLFAKHWNNLLGKAYDANDEMQQLRCLEHLQAYEHEALHLFHRLDNNSEPSDIVRDMVYCGVTPEETQKRLANYFSHINRRGRERDNSRSRVDDVPVWPG